MKKVLLSLLLVLSVGASRAQIGTDFGVNMFMTMGGGVSYYQSAGRTSFGQSGSIGVGKWILSPLAGRICLDMMSMPSIFNENYPATSAAASAEFLWDFNSTFTRIKHWRVNVYPMIGLGVILRSAFSYQDESGATRIAGTDREVQGMLGLNVPIRLGAGWDLFFQYKCHFLPENFDGAGKVSYLHTFMGGFTHNFTESPFHRRTEHESRSVSDDWFAGFGIGPNYSAFELFTNPNSGGLSMLGVAPEIMFGRNFSNFWTIRFEATGLTAHEQFDTVLQKAGKGYTFTMIHADVLMNLSHLVEFKRGVKWNFMPYIGAGSIWRYDNVMFDMAADFGLFVRRYISKEGDFFIDIKYVMMAPRIGGGAGPEGDIYGVGIPSLTFGYIHNFGHSSTRYRVPYGCAD